MSPLTSFSRRHEAFRKHFFAFNTGSSGSVFSRELIKGRKRRHEKGILVEMSKTLFVCTDTSILILEKFLIILVGFALYLLCCLVVFFSLESEQYL